MLSIPIKVLRTDISVLEKVSRLYLWITLRISQKFLGYYIASYTHKNSPIKFWVTKNNHQLIGNLLCEIEPLLASFMSICKQEDIFIDIGANIGMYSTFISSTTGCRAIALEPVNTTYQQLLLNQTLNPTSNLQTLHLACSDVNGFSSITNDLGPLNNLVTQNSDAVNKEIVKTVTLDNIFDFLITNDDASRVIIKVDTERHELNVLKGATKLLSLDRNIVISTEYYSLENANEIVDFLEKFGFVLSDCDSFGNLIAIDKSSISDSKFESNLIMSR